jgi:hypothetical protein
MERGATGVVQPCAGKMKCGLGLAVWPPPGSCRPGPARVFGARRKRDRTSRCGSDPEVVRRVPHSLTAFNANTLPGAAGSVLALPVAVAVGGIFQPVRGLSRPLRRRAQRACTTVGKGLLGRPSLSRPRISWSAGRWTAEAALVLVKSANLEFRSRGNVFRFHSNASCVTKKLPEVGGGGQVR